MKRMVVAVTLLLVAAAVSGCIFSSDDDEDVKKGKVSGKISMTITGEPVANVKVMLINRNAKIDTVNYANNAKAYVDSAFTDANGEFVIDGIAPGNYGVVPVNSGTDSTHFFVFTPSQNSGQYEFSLNGESRTVNFIAENMNVPGAFPNETFTIDVVVNLSPDKINEFSCMRRCETMGMPGWEWTVQLTPASLDDSSSIVRLTPTYGYTLLFYTLRNYFRFHLYLLDRTIIAGFTIDFPLFSVPAYSKFEYDYLTRQLVRIQ